MLGGPGGPAPSVAGPPGGRDSRTRRGRGRAGEAVAPETEEGRPGSAPRPTASPPLPPALLCASRPLTQAAEPAAQEAPPVSLGRAQPLRAAQQHRPLVGEIRGRRGLGHRAPAAAASHGNPAAAAASCRPPSGSRQLRPAALRPPPAAPAPPPPGKPARQPRAPSGLFASGRCAAARPGAFQGEAPLPRHGGNCRAATPKGRHGAPARLRPVGEALPRPRPVTAGSSGRSRATLGSRPGRESGLSEPRFAPTPPPVPSACRVEGSRLSFGLSAPEPAREAGSNSGGCVRVSSRGMHFTHRRLATRISLAALV